MNKIIAVSMLIGINFVCPAQNFFERDLSIPVSAQGKNLKYPWMGGLNNPQFSAADLNNDGINDMVIFDRTGFVVLTFLNKGTAGVMDYDFAPQYAQHFPPLIHWMMMGDYNCDGVQDIFSSKPAKIQVHTGKYNADNELEFEFADTLQYIDTSSGQMLDIFVTPKDVPAISDINGDGDLDVLTLDEVVGSVKYFENMSLENGRGCAGSAFKYVKNCWGNFYETGFRPSVVLDSCGILKKSRNGLNYSFLTYDENGDGDKEFILGLSSFDRITRLINGGTPDSAKMISQDANFPSYDTSYRVPLFPIASMLDVNNDDLTDLIIAPRLFNDSKNYDCVWYYKNIGNPDSAVFHFQTDTFLNNESLDFGEGAYPAFFDYNNDGLMDVVVGNYGYYVNGGDRSTLTLLENIGTATSPAFELADLDYAHLDTFKKNALVPTFGDLDGDGDEDMIVGDEEGYVNFFENTAGQGNVASFTLAGKSYFNMYVGTFSAPFLFDVNDDGLLDLIIGEKSGNLNYFENKGTATTPMFNASPDNPNFGQVDVRVPPSIFGYSKPVVSKLDDTGKLYLLVGSNESSINVYEFNRDKIYQGAFTRLFSGYSGIDEGDRVAVTVHDLTGDGKMEMVVGNYRGGLSFFSQTDSVLISVGEPALNDFEMEVYPNPAQNHVTVEFKGSFEPILIKISIVDLAGRELIKESLEFKENYSKVIDISSLPPGMYFCIATANAKEVASKFVVN